MNSGSIGHFYVNESETSFENSDVLVKLLERKVIAQAGLYMKSRVGVWRRRHHTALPISS